MNSGYHRGIPTNTVSAAPAQYMQGSVALSDLHPNPANPRSTLGNIDDLVESIREHGVLQPLLVTRRNGSGFTVLGGHRRLAAAKRAGRTTAPVLVIGPKLDDDRLVISLIENGHRADLSPLDEAHACQALLHMGRTRKEIALDLARSGSWVADRLALLELPGEVQTKVETGQLTLGQGAQLGHQLRRQSHGSVVAHQRAPFHFTRTHPLATAAAARCDRSDHPKNGRIGPACGACWESAIRTDALSIRGAA